MNVRVPKGDGSKYGDNLKPFQWGITEDGDVMIRCPHESHADKLPRLGIIRYAPRPNLDLSRNWKIDERGVVTPSIYFRDEACGWHVWATLEGWTP